MDKDIRKDIEVTNYDLNYDDDMMSWYSKEQDDLAIRNGEISEARNEGIKIGEERGITIGEKSKTIELAKKMKDKKMNIDDIIELTVLTKEEIEIL